MIRRNPRNVIALLLGTVMAPALRAQCELGWTAGDGIPGASARVHGAVAWDPDGPAGPAPECVVFGGAFAVAGAVACNGVACFDPTSGTWSALGQGVTGQGVTRSGDPGTVRALLVLANGDLVVAGDFDEAGGAPAANIARWDGSTWHALGAGLDGEALALAELGAGEVVVGGRFLSAGGSLANRLARWDGASWGTIGSPTAFAGAGASVAALARLGTGELVVGGTFDTVEGATASNLAIHDGVSWAEFGGGTDGTVTAVHEAGSDVFVGGLFQHAGGAPAMGIARWNSGSWSALGGGLGVFFAHARSITTTSSGELLVGGSFATAGGQSANNVARYAGGSWAVLQGGVNGPVDAVAGVQGAVYVAGAFGRAGTTTVRNCAAWTSAGWQPLATGTTGHVHALAQAGEELWVGGDFVAIAGVAARRIARQDASGWQAVGSGANGRVASLLALPDGEVLAGGSFTEIDGVQAARIARWDGSQWHALGQGLDAALVSADVRAMVAMPNGHVVVAGRFEQAGGQPANNVAAWDGAQWLTLGSGCNGPVESLLVADNGDLVVGGQFTQAGQAAAVNIARWNGSSWGAIGTGVAATVKAIAQLGPLLFAADRFWNGISWGTVGAGLAGDVLDLELAPNGHVFAAGAFGVARFRGLAWSEVAGPLDGVVTAMVRTEEALVVGGTFERAGGLASCYLARAPVPCPATATSYGSGCLGSAGPLSLSSQQLAWVGATARSEAIGLPSSALAVHVTGFASTSVALATLHPLGLPGCDLLASPDILTIVLPVAGVATAATGIPPAMSLVGETFFEQFVGVELQGGGIGAITSTNGLERRIGAF